MNSRKIKSITKLLIHKDFDVYLQLYIWSTKGNVDVKTFLLTLLLYLLYTFMMVTILFYYYVGKPSHCLKIVVVSNINITTEKHQNQYHAKRLSEVCI